MEVTQRTSNRKHLLGTNLRKKQIFFRLKQEKSNFTRDEANLEGNENKVMARPLV